MIEPRTVQRGGGVDRRSGLIGCRPGHLIAGSTGVQVFQNEHIGIGLRMEALGQPDAADAGCEFGVEAMFAFPDTHHLTDHLSTGISSGKFDDDTRRDTSTGQSHSGELAHEALAGADDLAGEFADVTAEDVSEPIGGQLAHERRCIRHGVASPSRAGHRRHMSIVNHEKYP